MSRSTMPLSTTGHHMQSVGVSDVVLVRCILQREPEALGALYDRYCPLVYTIALKMTDDATEAEAVVAAVFETIWNTAATALNIQDIAEWIICVTHHHGITHLQKHTRPFQHVTGSQHNSEQHYHPANNQEQAASRYTAVHLALTTLTVAELAAVEGTYYKGLPATQLALLLGESVEQVKAYLRQGLWKLQDHLGYNKSTRTPSSPAE